MKKFTKSHQESFLWYASLFFSICQDHDSDYKEQVTLLENCHFNDLGIGSLDFWQEEGYTEEQVRTAYFDVIYYMLDSLLVS